MKGVTFSVVVPTYRTSYDSLSKAIESVLSQTYSASEIILVDDNNDDDYRRASRKAEEVYKNKLKVLYNDKNSGANYSRNRGVDVAIGEFIAFLDSDDEWSKAYLSIVSEIIDEKKAQFITSNYQVVHREGVLPPEFDEKKFVSGDISKKELYQDLIGPTSTVVVSKKLIVAAGLFDVELPARQDYDMWLRIVKLAPVFYNYTPCVKVFRIGNNSISSSYKRNVEGTKIVLNKILTSNKLSDLEKKMVSAAHYKHMALSCILCDAYEESRKYARQSLKCHFTKDVFVWFLLSFCPKLFSALRNFRKKILYKL